MRHILYPISLLILLTVGCKPATIQSLAPTLPPVEERTLTVFAAASLIDAFTEIGEQFEVANPDVAVVFNFAGSQALRTQIEEGAPADVFASANKTEMDALVSGLFIAAETPRVFLNNQLVIILPADNPAGLETLDDLATPGIKLVLAAEEVPAGKYARQVLDTMNARLGMDFKVKVLANVVSSEANVKQVVTKVQLGEADAGIVYTSDAVAASELKTIAIPTELNVIAQYPIAALSESSNADLADAFIAYVLSEEGQAVLQKWGFSPVQ